MRKLILDMHKFFLCLFVFVSHTGSFKTGVEEAFGAAPIFTDITFITTLVMVLYFIAFCALSSPAMYAGMYSRIMSLKPILALAAVLWISYVVNGSDAGFSKCLIFSLQALPMCVIFACLLTDRKDIVWFLGFVFGFGLLLSCISLIFKTTDPFYFLRTSEVLALEDKPWAYARYAPLAISAAIIGLVNVLNDRFSAAVRACFGIAILICLMAAAYSGERASLVLFFVISILYMAHLVIYHRDVSKKEYRSLVIKAIVALVLLASLALLAMAFVSSGMGELFKIRWEIALDPYDNQDERLGYLKIFFKNLGSSPMIGVGVGNYFGYNTWETGMHPHNMFLELGGEMGVLGIIIYMWLLFCFIKGMLILHRRDKTDLSDVAIMVALLYFANAAKSGDITGNRMYWLFLSYFLCVPVFFKEKGLGPAPADGRDGTGI